MLILVDHTVYMLLLHSLSRILSQSASANTIRLAVLDDKKQFSNIAGSITTTSKLTADEVDSKEPVIIISDNEDEEEKEMSQSSKSSSGQGQKMDTKMDTSQNESSSVEIGSQVASLQMSDSGVSVPSTSAGGDGSGSELSPQQFTLAMLSTALQNVNQTLGIPPGDDKPQEEAATGRSQTDTDSSVDVPGEKRPRLDTHEVTTLQQSTLPQDIHDKLHSNIR